MMRCKSLAEMPMRRVEISKIARNHVLSGLRVHTRLPSQRAHDGSPPQRAATQ
jgi:hypothetical protein